PRAGARAPPPRAGRGRAGRSLDDLRHAEEAPVARGRVGEERLRGGRVRRHVVAEGGAVLLDLRGGLDRARVEGAEPRERLEDVTQVGGQALLVGGLEEEAREHRDPPHLLARDGHRALVAYRSRPRNDDCLAGARRWRKRFSARTATRSWLATTAAARGRSIWWRSTARCWCSSRCGAAAAPPPARRSSRSTAASRRAWRASRATSSPSGAGTSV